MLPLADSKPLGQLASDCSWVSGYHLRDNDWSQRSVIVVSNPTSGKVKYLFSDVALEFVHSYVRPQILLLYLRFA